MLSLNQIETRVQRLLNESRIRSAPVRIEKIAKRHGITLKKQTGESNISGALFKNGSVSVIAVNEIHAPSRQRFTIAHELGHYFLHNFEVHFDHDFISEATVYKGREKVFLRNATSSEAKDPKEIEANRFAAALLMPVSLLRKCLKPYSVPLSGKGVEALAEKFRVSQQAMTFRLLNLGVQLDIS